MNWPEATWDGLPVTAEPPYGAAILVWRRSERVEWLLLHRAHHGPEYAGDWAWGPPAGARQPDEPVEECARRELLEEADLDLLTEPTPCGTEDWLVFAAEAPTDAEVSLSAEHDALRWATTEEAQQLCLPRSVGDSFACVAALIAQR